MRNALILFVLFFAVLPVQAQVYESVQDAKNAKIVQEQPKDSLVYITPNGGKYHKAGCRYLTQSKIHVQLNEVRKSYEPCLNCYPQKNQLKVPASASQDIVYITKTGKKYHRGGCRYLSRSQIPIKRSAAIRSYGACKVCRP